MIELISTPGILEPLDPTIICRWLATESENNFRFQRRDYAIVTTGTNGGYLQITVAAGSYTGAIGNSISVFNKRYNAMYTGVVAAGSTSTVIETDIEYLTGGFDPTDTALDPDRTDAYFNDNTEFGSYYFEGRLTINGVLEALTIAASPDSFGYADLDVSGILRIKISNAKTGDYLTQIMKEPTKSGRFSLEYRGCWAGSSELWIPEGGCISPPSDEILWYYGEAVRSEEQGSNLYEYVVNSVRDAPFLNLFDRPVYFKGLPFDLSFIFPEFAIVTPTYDIAVTMKIYNSTNTQLGGDIVTYVTADTLEGFINSLSINPGTIPAGADHLTVEITI